MFSKIKAMASAGMESLLADRSIPVSEDFINDALKSLIQDIPELTSVALDIQDGSFELVAEGKKVIPFNLRTRFEISACEISATKQVVTFRQISKTELSADKLMERILIQVFKAIACGIFRVEPTKLALEGLPGVTISGDDYTVNLAEAGKNVQLPPHIASALTIAGAVMKVKELKCVPQAIQVMIGR